MASVKEKSNSVLSWSACDEDGYDMAAELGLCLTWAAVMDSKVATSVTDKMSVVSWESPTDVSRANNYYDVTDWRGKTEMPQLAASD